MNEQTRYVMAIYEVGVIIRDTMEYLLPANKDGYRLDVYPADGETFGEADGYDCNSEMIDNADALIVFWYGVGREVRKMIETAWKFDLELHEIEI